MSETLPTITTTDIEQSEAMPVDQMFDTLYRGHEHLQSISLSKAVSGEEVSPEISGMSMEDLMPTTPARELNTGLLPPVDEAEINFLQIQNKEASNRHMLAKLMEANNLSLADTRGYRIRVAYRLLRHHLRIRGLLFGWERIQPVLDESPTGNGMSGWIAPMPINNAIQLTGFRGVRNILLQSAHGKETFTFNTPNGYARMRGTTVLPPPIPDHLYGTADPIEIWRMRASRTVPSGYTPTKDNPLILFCEAMGVLATQMNIQAGAPEEPWAGIYGLAGLLDPHVARLAWPTRDELVLFEEELLLKVFERLTRTTEIQTQIYLKQFFGFSRFEAIDITKTAKEAGGILYNESAETERAILLKRTDTIADKCADACDVRAELSAIKLKAQLLGLTATDTSDSMQAMRDAASRALKYDELDEDIE